MTATGVRTRSQVVSNAVPASATAVEVPAEGTFTGRVDDATLQGSRRVPDQEASAPLAGWRWGRDWGPAWNSADVAVMEYVVLARDAR